MQRPIVIELESDVIELSAGDIIEFADEDDTEPMLLMSVQEQVNAAHSVAAFTERAERMHWTERLDMSLDTADLVDMMEGL